MMPTFPFVPKLRLGYAVSEAPTSFLHSEVSQHHIRKTTMHIAIPLETMTTADKLRAIEEIRADPVGNLEANESDSVPSPSWHADVLRAREQRIADGASRFPDIAEAKQAVREKIG
uniref:Addiction module component n=1 Tax=Candidatus Kentrum sp. LPFa TaxID=2126335 RepID=A0A450X6C0_9GAMM|nr:MAG: hypothetical protein BECKLPF1236A_GA0070988_104393 [Candidatus Kentron sp. LPFa]VFK35926.1 MAG: hypothetical protein BECKLPF1236C_GA0070990_104473 [Candidatus Kentron sp. LPFa]